MNYTSTVEPLPADLAIEIVPRDLSAYREGNCGIPFAFVFHSGVPGPRVAINALTHGNEFCGMVAVCAMLDAGLRPERGSLSLSFANVAAYESFDIAAPFESRQLVHNLNRIWSDAELAGDQRSPEFDRAREMRSLFDPVYALLDIHSTSQDVPPFFVHSPSAHGAGGAASGALADGIGLPPVQLLMPGGMQTGTPLIEYGPFSPKRVRSASTAEPFAPGAGGAVVVECGQHFSARAGVLATQVSLAFLRQTGLLSAASASSWSVRLTGVDAFAELPTPPRRYQLLSTHVIQTPHLRWVRPLQGMEVFAKDELIGHDGEFEIRSPCDDCTIFMPLASYRPAVPGREGAYFTRLVS